MEVQNLQEKIKSIYDYSQQQFGYIPALEIMIMELAKEISYAHNQVSREMAKNMEEFLKHILEDEEDDDDKGVRVNEN